jgi:hypothetical protein
MGLIFALQWAGARVFIPSNLRRVVFNMRLVCASKWETFVCGVAHAPGMWNDLSIFRDRLMTYLEPGEQVETDRGYSGSAPKYVKCPNGLLADPDLAVKLMAA